jgi:phosphoenolpyruvate carboxykinase (GTP)
MPLVYQAFDWQHGVFLGATMTSETTAAATGAVGVVRQDPMAMLPFCGYNMGDYFSHWLRMGQRLPHPPQIFRVNWFRRNAAGKYLWPGFGENLRVLRWMLARVHGEVGAAATPIGYIPHLTDLDLTGLDLAPEVLQELFAIDRAGWLDAVAAQQKFLQQFGTRLPAAIWQENTALKQRLQA